MAERPPILLRHNLDPRKFVWLWAKYVTGVNLSKHCTNALRGPYSKLLSAHNDSLLESTILRLGERPLGSFCAIYICGVAKKGYSRKANYPHNLHAAIEYAPGVNDRFVFEEWSLEVENGRFLRIPSLDELAPEFAGRPEAFTSCRIFRWAASYRPH
jgi:hypothetical protein